MTVKLSVSWPGKNNESLCCAWLWHNGTLGQDLSLLLFSAAVQSIPSAGKEKAQPSARGKQAPLLSPHFLQNGLGNTAEANFTQRVICHICCNISVANLDFRVWPAFCTKFPYYCMEQFMQRKNKVKAKEAAKVLGKRVALFWKDKKNAGVGALWAQLWAGSAQSFSDAAPSARYRAEKTLKMCSKLQSTGREGLRELSMTHPSPSNTKNKSVGMRGEEQGGDPVSHLHVRDNSL